MLDARPRFVCLTLAGTLLAGTGRLAAEESPSECPRSAEVASRLDQLLVSGADAGGAAEKIVIRDRGPSWEIEVDGHRASYDDPVRDCAERVRVATVFAALALEPPDAKPPAEVQAAAAPQPVAQPALHRRIELAPALVLGLRSADTTTAWGGVLRWQISGVRLGLTAGLGGMLPTVVRAGAYEAKLARMAFDLSPRAWLRMGPASFALELGPFVGLLFATGRNLSPDDSSTSLDAGARLAIRVELAARLLSPFLAAQGELSVRRFQMLVEPRLEAGTAPRVWLGLLLGAAFGL